MIVQQSIIPTALGVHVEVRADTPEGIRAALGHAIIALKAGVEPNMLWGDGYCVAIRVGGGS